MKNEEELFTPLEEVNNAYIVDKKAFNDLVNSMTNYERNKWAKAKYPGLLRKDLPALRSWLGRKRVEILEARHDVIREARSR